MKNQFAVPEYATSEQIRQCRKSFQLTQKEFAELVNCSKPTVERWERGDGEISGPISLLVFLLEQYPEILEQLRIPEKKYPLRLWYMHKQNLCTLIDVDELHHKVMIQNFTTHVMYRAFGNSEIVTYEDYQAFLESRCFPRSRDKMKLILKDLNLPFYDPIMIIQKTEGRMAEDDFWIRIER